MASGGFGPLLARRLPSDSEGPASIFLVTHEACPEAASVVTRFILDKWRSSDRFYGVAYGAVEKRIRDLKYGENDVILDFSTDPLGLLEASGWEEANVDAADPQEEHSPPRVVRMPFLAPETWGERIRESVSSLASPAGSFVPLIIDEVGILLRYASLETLFAALRSAPVAPVLLSLDLSLVTEGTRQRLERRSSTVIRLHEPILRESAGAAMESSLRVLVVDRGRTGRVRRFEQRARWVKEAEGGEMRWDEPISQSSDPWLRGDMPPQAKAPDTPVIDTPPAAAGAGSAQVGEGGGGPSSLRPYAHKGGFAARVGGEGRGEGRKREGEEADVPRDLIVVEPGDVDTEEESSDEEEDDEDLDV